MLHHPDAPPRQENILAKLDLTLLAWEDHPVPHLVRHQTARQELARPGYYLQAECSEYPDGKTIYSFRILNGTAQEVLASNLTVTSTDQTIDEARSSISKEPGTPIVALDFYKQVLNLIQLIAEQRKKSIRAVSIREEEYPVHGRAPLTPNEWNKRFPPLFTALGYQEVRDGQWTKIYRS